MRFLIANDDVEAVYRLQDNWNLQLLDFTNVLDWNGKLQKIFFGWILFQNWFVLHWSLLDNTANYTHHVKGVFIIQSCLKDICIISWIEGKAQNSLKSTMPGEESWKHKDFSSLCTFSMLKPKPILCNCCTTNSEPPLLWCILAANARSKGQSMVLGLASLISVWPIAAIFTSFGFDRGGQRERMKNRCVSGTKESIVKLFKSSNEKMVLIWSVRSLTSGLIKSAARLIALAFSSSSCFSLPCL